MTFSHPIGSGLKIFQKSPEIKVFTDTLYIPRIYGLHDDNYGIYDCYGRLVQSAGPRRGWPNKALGQSQSSRISPSSSYPHAPDDYYFYGGHVGAHFGHFLTETLPRFWCDPILYLNKKIIIHSGETIENLFSFVWIKEIFEMLGLVKEQFIIFDRPTTIDNLVVAGTSFEENHFAHRQFGELCNRISRKYSIDLGIKEPIFISREKYKSAMRNIEGEVEVVDLLKKSGFRIVYPETLSIREQMGIFASNRFVSGFVGSAFHNSIFQHRPRGLALCYGDNYSTNFWLMDQVNDANIQYVATPTLSLENFPRIGIPAEYKIGNPQEVANTVIEFSKKSDFVSNGKIPVKFETKEGPYLIKTNFDLFLQIDRQLGLVHAGSGKGARIHKIFGYIYDSEWLEICSPDGDVLSMDDLESISDVLSFKIYFDEDKKTALLQNSVTKRFVSSNHNGSVECNREIARNWERFTFIPVD